MSNGHERSPSEPPLRVTWLQTADGARSTSLSAPYARSWEHPS
jgi:hypothetical protein